MSRIPCTLTINGERHQLLVAPLETLSHVLREQLDLIGTKEGCGMGECGTCTVLIDEKPVMSCITLALEVQETQIQTIEGLAEDGKLHPLQQSFVEKGAVQCGFCTPGMILSAKAFLASGAEVNATTISHALSGNHCRCTGYTKIVAAVLDAHQRMETGS